MGPVTLPPHLSERVEPKSPPPRAGAYVICWLRIAVRATENPALDVALTAAQHLGVPCFVYHAVSERYRYASDRLHTFILEGARDLQRDLRARGVGCVFHLQRHGDRRPHLLELAARAALVVSDFMPVEPLLRWDGEVAKAAPTWRVDASCLAPVWAFPQPVDRPFVFRKAAAPLWNTRVTAPWVDVEPKGAPFVPEFDSLDLLGADLPALVASCDIDHAVAPVHDTPGGATAGLARWQRYVDGTLDRYAKDRNDPVREANSRISGYLHFGHLSPFRVARDCASRRTDGAEKFLDELLTFRELAWHFCWHHPRHETVDVLPAWARDTLREHERDGRTFLPSWDQLARARTGHPLWDACQRSLLTHGELHNNVRMTWGKALIPWTRNAKEALALLIDLNHRYALDGRDPASYGGILWCLGALDRPFTPEQPFFGQVRPRLLDEQAKRFDVAEYERRVHRPSRGRPLVVAVVGAGVSGTACARALVDAGHAVTLFDKGRGPGGRLSTRKTPEGTFDHGAPFFSVHDERFARTARALWSEGVVAEWKPRLVTLGPARPLPLPPLTESPRVVAQPGMSALLERLQSGLDVRFGVTVDALARRDERFALKDTAGVALGEYDAVVVSTPAPQAAALLDPLSYELASDIRRAAYAPVWAVMVAFDGSLSLDFDAAHVTVGPLSFVAKDSSRPHRQAGERWVLHASTQWSRAHVDATPEQVAAVLLDAFFASAQLERKEPTLLVAHRWRYALVETPLGVPCVVHPSGRVVACGDWCLGPTVEHAFLSGQAAAGRLNALAPEPVVDEPPPRRVPAQMKLV